jgi:predicted transcriptional regulator
MSGLEVLGVAASIIQIADLGARVSIKLSTFYHKVKQANDNIQNLSTDVALTCTVLKQLGDNLQQDENVKLYSPDAFSVAKDIMGECDKVFRQIESAMEDDIISASPSASTSAVKHHVRKAAHKLHFVFLEPQLSVLQSNLDRLKSTMLLMLNVIIYAGQVRRKEAEVKQQGQKEIIEILVDEQKIKTKRYQQLTKAIEFVDPEESTRAASPYTSQDDAPFGVLALQDNTKNPDESIPEELTKYANLIKSLLTSVDEMKFALDSARYQRIKKGVLTIHDKELPPFLHQHGDSTCNKLFDGPLFER